MADVSDEIIIDAVLEIRDDRFVVRYNNDKIASIYHVVPPSIVDPELRNAYCTGYATSNLTKHADISSIRSAISAITL